MVNYKIVTDEKKKLHMLKVFLPFDDKKNIPFILMLVGLCSIHYDNRRYVKKDITIIKNELNTLLKGV